MNYAMLYVNTAVLKTLPTIGHLELWVFKMDPKCKPGLLLIVRSLETILYWYVRTIGRKPGKGLFIGLLCIPTT